MVMDKTTIPLNESGQMRLMVIVNKNWETEPLLNALTNPKLRPAPLPFPFLVNTPKDDDNKMTDPRAKFCLCGGTFFLHDGHPGNPESNLQSEYVGQLLPSNVNRAVFDLVSEDSFAVAEGKFISPPNTPATGGFFCMANPNYAAASSINVTDYSEYTRVDEEGRRHFEQVPSPGFRLVSLETTHGVVKISTARPILFLSPITDRLGHFDDDVTDTQNYVCAFNGGLALGQLFCELAKYLKEGGMIHLQ